MMTLDPVRLTSAAALVLAYAAWCIHIMRRVAARPLQDGADWLVVYASQTGSAEALAARTAATLVTGGLSAQALDIARLNGATLAGATRILFIASTYGEGDPPDSAALFCHAVMGKAPDLSHLHFAVLALGDSSYSHFCGFGRTLDAWLAGRGAQRLFARIDVDKGASAPLARWQQELSHLAGTSDAPDWEAPAYAPWRVVARELSNPGSAGTPLYRVVLQADGATDTWQAGDLAQIAPPGEPDRPREYSIASLPAEGHIALLVRLHRRADGGTGAASGWLCQGAGASDRVALRVRAHGRFRLGANAARPLILIGNGSGLAGLRAHLKARIDAGVHENWLIFGERHPQIDTPLGAELEQWHASGALPRLDRVYSRDAARPRYVQQIVDERAVDVAAWVARGAAIYVCGSLQGMAGGVHAALQAALGADVLAQLDADGRYRRDVY